MFLQKKRFQESIQYRRLADDSKKKEITKMYDLAGNLLIKAAKSYQKSGDSLNKQVPINRPIHKKDWI